MRVTPSSAQEVKDDISAYFAPISMNALLLLLPPPSQWTPVSPLSPNPAHFPTFLNCLPRLSQEEKESLEVPFIAPELAAAVEEAAPNKSPDWMTCPMSFIMQLSLFLTPPPGCP
jgi:hypothetical protein